MDVTASIETRASWIAVMAALAVMSVGFGAPFVTVVALKPIAAELGGARSVPSLAFSLVWLGTAVGGLVMARLAERVGTRRVAIFGAVMIAVGLALAGSGGVTRLYLAHGLLIGALGLGALNAPLYVYVSRWFDRRRGSALALISSGTYVAGAVWPPLFERTIAAFGWRETMLLFAVVVLVLIVPIAAIFLRPPPDAAPAPAAATQGRARVLGLRPGVAHALLSAASFFCCVTMVMPQGHLIAFCSDLGIAPTASAAMLSVLLVTAFISRQIWGYISDRIGGLATVLAASSCQAAAVVALLFTQDEAGLFAVSAAFGFGFSGIVPAYLLAIREHFAAAEAAARMPVLLLCSGCGMAFGGWLAGALYDHYGFYGAAFAAGLAANLVNLAIVGFLVGRGVALGALRPGAAVPSLGDPAF